MVRVNKNLQRRIQQALYALKKEYATGPVSIYNFNGTTVNLETGQKVVSRDVTVLNKVILLPATLKRDVVQTISMISANKKFVYGGSHDARTRTFIVDRRDAPNLQLAIDDSIVYDGHKWEIIRIQEFEYRSAWVISAKQLVGDTPEQIHPLASDHRISLVSSATGEV